MAVLIFPPLAVAADPPDLKGCWSGKTHSIVAGKGAHWPTSSGTFEKPLLAEKDLVIEITGQQGRRFWGVQIGRGYLKGCAAMPMSPQDKKTLPVWRASS